MEMLILSAVCSFCIGAILVYFIFNSKLSNLQKELSSKNQELVRLETKLENTNELESLCKKIANETVAQTNEEIIEKNKSMLQPFKDELKAFKEKVENLKDTGIKTNEALREKIDNLTRNSDALRFKAEELTASLKLNSKSRGIFGELVLEQILNSSGLINKKDDEEAGNYITQKGFKNVQMPQERPSIPDAVIFFPENDSHIVIDSKLPLNNFQNFMNEQDEEQKKVYLKDFYSSLETMVESLSGKYNTLEGLNTPDFKILFIPLETAYLYAFENRELIINSTKKNVVIAGPSSLIAILKVIKQCWNNKKISDNMEKMQKLGNNIYNTFCIFLNKMDILQKKFDSVSVAFDDTFKTMKGQKGLSYQFENFKNLGLNPSKQIDSKYFLNDTDTTEEVKITAN